MLRTMASVWMSIELQKTGRMIARQNTTTARLHTHPGQDVDAVFQDAIVGDDAGGTGP
jgi:hypothetical protein